HPWSSTVRRGCPRFRLMVRSTADISVQGDRNRYGFRGGREGPAGSCVRLALVRVLKRRGAGPTFVLVRNRYEANPTLAVVRCWYESLSGWVSGRFSRPSGADARIGESGRFCIPSGVDTRRGS